MKFSKSNNKKQGFTLVELLVVIAIIAVLAGVGTTAAIGALEKSKKVKATGTATNVVTSITQFYEDYSTLPDITGTANPIIMDSVGDITLDLNVGDGPLLLNILAASETTVPPQNRRQLKYLDIPEAKNNLDGISYVAASDTIDGLFDPWGNSYTVILDTNYSDRIDYSISAITGAEGTGTVRGQKALVYSLGVKDAGDASPKRLVKTW